MSLPPTLSGSLLVAKEQALTYQPLLLAEFTFHDGAVLRIASHQVTYGGNLYLARLLDQDVAATQILSESGVDVPSAVALSLADADRFLWDGYESAKGFKGAVLKLTFVFWELGTANFSSDSQVRFRGTCDGPAEVDHLRLKVNAQSRLSLARKQFPEVRVQPRCPWPFPRNAAEREAAGNDTFSIFHFCGYSVDATANQRGNLNGAVPAVPYTSCSFNPGVGGCLERLGDSTPLVGNGPLDRDQAGRATGAFGGIAFAPPKTFRGRSYGVVEFSEFENDVNEAKFGDFFPEVYGRAWIDALVMHTRADGNATGFEAVLSFGKIENVLQVVVNDVVVPAATRWDGTALPIAEPLLAWYQINDGDKFGHSNALPGWNLRGDPYGNLAAIAVVVFKEVAQSNAVPRVAALVDGRHVRIYSAVGVFAFGFTSNPAWILLDLLYRSGWTQATVDQQSFIDAAAVCAATVTFTDNAGRLRSHERYRCSLALRQRRSAAEIISGVRRAMKAMLVENTADAGKLRLIVKRTLAEQQPAAVSGSNHATAVKSMNAAGAVVNGFVAYRFSESSILDVGEDDPEPALTVSVRSIADSPNAYQVAFQDAENAHAPTSLTIPDIADVVRSNQQVLESLAADGIENQDQAKRVVATELAEVLRGNPRVDTGGTYVFSLLTTFRAVHLNVGDIVLVQSASLDLQDNVESPPGTPIAGALARVIALRPDANFERLEVVAAWHRDEWYTDIWGQVEDPGFSRPERDRLSRPPFPWLPNGACPPSGDPLWQSTDCTFGIALEYDEQADRTALARLVVSGKLPVNSFSDLSGAPLVPRQATTASTGGSLAGGRDYWFALCSKDAVGAVYKVSPPSELVKAVVPAGTSTNKVTIPDIAWPAAAAGYLLFGGENPYRLSHLATVDSKPTSIEVLGPLNVGTLGVPDVEFDKLLVRVKKVEHSGVFGTQLTGVGTFTMTVAGVGWAAGEWAGRVVSVIGFAGDQGAVPIANYTVVSNTTDTLTVSQSTAGAAIQVGDVIVMRTAPTAVTATSIADAKFVNSLALTGLNVDEEIGRILRIIAGKGRGQVRRVADNDATTFHVERAWDVTPDATSVFIVEAAEWDPEAALTTSADNAAFPGTAKNFKLPITNLADRVLLVQAVTIDGGGNPSPDGLSPAREIYAFGDPGDIPGAEAAAGNVTNLDASEDPFIQADGTVVSSVTVSFDAPAPLGTFKGVELWIAKLVAQGGALAEEKRFLTRVEHNAAPPARRFTHPVTNAWHRIWAASFNSQFANDPDASPTKDVLLDGQQSAPADVGDFHCQRVVNGFRLSWLRNAELDLDHYEIAHTFDKTPYSLSSALAGVKPEHVVASAPRADPRSSALRLSWEFREALYIGDSNGTVVTLLGTDPVFRSNQLLVETSSGVFQGANAQFIRDGLAALNAAVVSNAATTVTFAAASVPTGRVKFYLRGSDGSHRFWIVAVDSSGKRSDLWADHESCSPYAIDGSLDLDVPQMQSGLQPLIDSMWSLGSQADLFPWNAGPAKPGGIVVALAARGGGETESDYAKALKQNIGGIVEWSVKVELDAGDPQIFTLASDQARERYSHVNQGGFDFHWVLFNVLGFLFVPDVAIARVLAAARNSFGWSPYLEIVRKNMPTGLGPFYSGRPMVRRLETETASAGSVYPNVSKSDRFVHQLAAAVTVQAPEYRAADTAKGSGLAPVIGEEFAVIVKQPASGTTTYGVAWAAAYKGVSDKPVLRLVNHYTAWTFHVEAAGSFLCVGYVNGVLS